MQANLNKKKILIIAGSVALIVGTAVGGYYAGQSLGLINSTGQTPDANKPKPEDIPILDLNNENATFEQKRAARRIKKVYKKFLEKKKTAAEAAQDTGSEPAPASDIITAIYETGQKSDNDTKKEVNSWFSWLKWPFKKSAKPAPKISEEDAKLLQKSIKEVVQEEAAAGETGAAQNTEVTDKAKAELKPEEDDDDVETDFFGNLME